jgi:hypothetical protein
MVEISTEKKRLDVALIHRFLSEESYWAVNIPLDLVRTSIENSLCFGAYEHGAHVGFARAWSPTAPRLDMSPDVFPVVTHRGTGVV